MKKDAIRMDECHGTVGQMTKEEDALIWTSRCNGTTKLHGKKFKWKICIQRHYEGRFLPKLTKAATEDKVAKDIDHLHHRYQERF